MYCDQSCCEPLKKMLPLSCNPHIFILFWFLLLIFCYDIDLWAEVIIRVKKSQESSESLDSDDDFRSGCRNVSHHYQQQSFSGLHSPRWLNYTITCYPQVQTIYCIKCIYFLFLATITFLLSWFRGELRLESCLTETRLFNSKFSLCHYCFLTDYTTSVKKQYNTSQRTVNKYSKQSERSVAICAESKWSFEKR